MLPVLLKVVDCDNLPALYTIFFGLLLDRLKPLLPLIFLAQKRIQRCLSFGGEPVDPQNKVRLVSLPAAHRLESKRSDWISSFSVLDEMTIALRLGA